MREREKREVLVVCHLPSIHAKHSAYVRIKSTTISLDSITCIDMNKLSKCLNLLMDFLVSKRVIPMLWPGGRPACLPAYVHSHSSAAPLRKISHRDVDLAAEDSSLSRRLPAPS